MHNRQEHFKKFDVEIEKIGTIILSRDNSNPYANYYLATHYNDLGLKILVHRYYRAIIEVKNYTKGWYTIEAENWIKNNSN